MKKKVSIKDIAERAGVSIGTVDRVIHNRGRVSEKTREKVLKICREMDYQPNLLARQLASDKTWLFATFTPKPRRDNAYWSLPLEGIRKAAEEIAGYRVTVKEFFFDINDEESFRHESLNLLVSQPDGVIIAPIFHREAEDLIRKLQMRKIPFIFIDSHLEGTDYLSYFAQDPFRSGYLAGRLIWFHLKKHSEVVIINFTSDLENHLHLKQRETGLRQFLKDHHFKGHVRNLNISPRDELLLSHTLYENLHHKTRGLFATSSAHKVARSIRKIRREELMFVGYDLTPDNVNYLNQGVIDVLLCQKPMAQGYGAMRALFDHFVRRKEVKKEHPMPIEIVVKENYTDYSDL
jgi:LacI family transcriptional regulator